MRVRSIDQLTPRPRAWLWPGRLVSLPCREETIRGCSNVSLPVIDEASRVPDDVYRAVRPMLAVSNGRLFCLSTPHGKRGFFHDAWARGGDDWARIEVPAARIPRISAEFLAQERRGLGESWFRQEYCCSFEALQGLVYPDFARCVVHALPPDLQGTDATLLPSPLGGEGLGVRGKHPRRVGGIDFGFRNPFAAVWGFVDGNGVLWLTGEHYSRQKPLSYHTAHLPRNVKWYADPAGASERCELRCAGFTVAEGDNALRPGIAAVSARLENGTLRVLEGRCPNLLYEAALYRYSDDPSERHAEVPVDEHNHALAALRYLISRLVWMPAGWPGTATARTPPSQTPPRPRAKNAPGCAWTTRPCGLACGESPSLQKTVARKSAWWYRRGRASSGTGGGGPGDLLSRPVRRGDRPLAVKGLESMPAPDSILWRPQACRPTGLARGGPRKHGTQCRFLNGRPQRSLFHEPSLDTMVSR